MATKSIGIGVGAAATGTVSVTNGSTAVTGSGTSFTTEFAGPVTIEIAGVLYNVASITNNTSLVLSENYAGSTGSGKTIKIGLRNFFTLRAWATYINALTLSAPEVGEVYNDGIPIEDDGSITFAGWSGATSTNTITLRPAAGHGFRDHPNKLTNALRFNPANGVACKITPIDGYTHCLVVNGPYFNIDGMQFFNTAPAELLIHVDGSFATHCKVTNCIFEGPTTLAVCRINNSTGGAFQNNLVVVRSSGYGLGVTSFQTAAFNGNTIVATNGATSAGILAIYGSATVYQNNVVYGFGVDYDDTVSASSSNNATDKSSFGGTNWGGSGQTSITSAEFESVTDGSHDLRLKLGGTKLQNTGATVGLATDILGTSRPQGSAYDIGCWERIPFRPFWVNNHNAVIGGK